MPRALCGLGLGGSQGSASLLRTLVAPGSCRVYRRGQSTGALCCRNVAEQSAHSPSQGMTQAPRRLPVTSRSSFHLAVLLQHWVFKHRSQSAEFLEKSPSEQACPHGQAGSLPSRVQPHRYFTLGRERPHAREFLQY